MTINKGNDSLTISQGNLSIAITAGSGTIEAGQTITLKVGSSSIVVSQQGVTIKGPQVSVQGTAQVQVQAPMHPGQRQRHAGTQWGHRQHQLKAARPASTE